MGQIQSPVMVGRDLELAAIQRGLTEALSGRGGVAVISGEAGIGKSRLVREAEAMASRRGVRILRGRAVRGSAHLPYRPLAEAVQSGLRDDAAVRRDPDLRPFRAALGQLIPEWSSEARGADESGLLVPEAILRLLRLLASPASILLIVEDLHWADEDTLAVMDYLADQIRSERIFSLLTVRSDSPGPHASRLAALIARRAAVDLRLRPLRDKDVELMARACLGGDDVPPADLVALHRRSEGIPFLVEEILTSRGAAAEVNDSANRTPGVWTAEDRAISYRELVSARLETLSGEARAVVTAAAVLGRTFDWPLLVALTDRPEPEVLESLKAAIGVHVLSASGGAHPSSFFFRHALVREAILEDLLPSEHSALSSRAAEVIESLHPGLPGEWCELAADLRERAGDRLAACRLLQESARRALARSALATAEGTLMRARELAGEDHMAWIGVDELLFEVLVRAGKTQKVLELSRTLIDFMERRRVSAVAADRGEGQVRGYSDMLTRPRLARLHLQVAQAGAMLRESAVARASIESARRVAGDDELVVAQALTVSAQLALAEGDAQRAGVGAASAVERGERAGSTEIVIGAFDVLARSRLRAGDLAGARTAFSEIERRAGDQLAWRARALASSGAVDAWAHGDITRLEQARIIAADIGAVSQLAAIDVEIARRELDLGRFDLARRSLDQALGPARRFGLEVLGFARVTEGTLFALTQDAGAMERSLAEARRVAANDPVIESLALGEVQAVFLLLRDERAAARVALARAFDLWLRSPSAPPWFAGVWALLAAFERDEATPVRAAVVTSGATGNPQVDACVAYADAVVAGANGDDARVALELERGDALFVRGWRYHTARLLAAEAGLRDGWGDPGAWARAALEFFAAVGMRRSANAAKRLMRQAGTPVPRRGRGDSDVPVDLRRLRVTSREMDVLRLVAVGLGNGAIARQLYLSPRTVEAHVSSLMRKAGAGSRSELVALARLGEPQAQQGRADR